MYVCMCISALFRFRQGFLSVFHFFLRIPRTQPSGDNLALNQMNHTGGNHTQNHRVNGNGKAGLSSKGAQGTGATVNTTNNTTVRLNGSAVSTTLQQPSTTPKSNCTLSVSVNVETKMNQSQCNTESQEL